MTRPTEPSLPKPPAGPAPGHPPLTAGLDPEQTIRTHALHAATRTQIGIARDLLGVTTSTEELRTRKTLLDLADVYAAYINDSSHPPAPPACICPQGDVTPWPGYPAVEREFIPGQPDPRCPQHRHTEALPTPPTPLP